MSQFESEISNGITIKDSEADFQDKTMTCNDCSKDFIWSVGEQIFFRDKGLQNPPKRCKPCKQAKNERIEAVMAAQAAGVRQKIEVAVHCARCNEYTTVPFYPSQGRPVYCRTCFLAMNPEILSSENNGNGNHPPT